MKSNLLEVSNLKTYFFTSQGVVKAVDDVSFVIRQRETIGLVGESGCGKTMTALSVMRLVPNPPGRIVGGKIILKGKDIFGLSELEMRRLRGSEIGMIFQDPMTFLNPVMKIADQLTEALVEHRKMSAGQARNRMLELLRMVNIPSADKVQDYYPHQLSGGMRQRVLTAMAMSCEPSLLIADEPTTALDVTVQAQILKLIRELRDKLGTSLLLITHDLGVVGEICDRVCVMYAGKIVETGDVFAMFRSPEHPYTVGLLSSILRMDEYKETLPTIDGVVPDLVNPPSGCRFNPRCMKAMSICREKNPPSFEIGPDHFVSCWLKEGGKA